MKTVKALALAICCFGLGVVASAQNQVDLEVVRGAPTSQERNHAIKDLLRRGKPLTLQEQMNSRNRITFDAAALIGVDALGRVALATDADRDGTAEMYALLAAKSRLQGPWAWSIPQAKVTYMDGSISIESSAGAYGFVGTGAGKKALRIPKERYTEYFEIDDAVEFSISFGGTGTSNAMLMTTLNHSDVESWPISFWIDNHQVRTGTLTCEPCHYCRNIPQGTTGIACRNSGQAQCTITPTTCSANDSGCNIVVCGSNSDPNDYSCCSCAGPLSLCRCQTCTPGACGGVSC